MIWIVTLVMPQPLPAPKSFGRPRRCRRSTTPVESMEWSAAGQRWPADLVVAATGAPGTVARMLGAARVSEEPFGLAIRTYAETPAP